MYADYITESAGGNASPLRDVLGDQTYESLTRKGETLTTAAIAAYAYDQIDQARTELEQPADSKGNATGRG